MKYPSADEIQSLSKYLFEPKIIMEAAELETIFE